MLNLVGADIKEVGTSVIEFAKRNTLSKGHQCKPILIGQNITFDIGFLQQMMNYDGTEMMAVISGYDLNIAFNMRTINSLSDAEAAADALAQVFYELLMEQLLASQKSELVKERPTIERGDLYVDYSIMSSRDTP